MTNQSPFNRIANTLWAEFAVGASASSPEAVLWAAAKQHDPEACVSALNRRRQRRGNPLVYVPHGYFEGLRGTTINEGADRVGGYNRDDIGLSPDY